LLEVGAKAGTYSFQDNDFGKATGSIHQLHLLPQLFGKNYVAVVV